MGNKHGNRIYNNECPICLEDEKEDRGRSMDRLVCGHGVHRHSCLPDLYAPVECPICRVPFKYRKNPIQRPPNIPIQPPPNIPIQPPPNIPEAERIIDTAIFNPQLIKYIRQLHAHHYTFKPRFKNHPDTPLSRIFVPLAVHEKSGLSQEAVSLCVVSQNLYTRHYNIIYGIYSPQMRLDDVIYIVIDNIKYPIIIRHMNRFHMPLFDASPLIHHISPHTDIRFEYPEHIRDMYILGGSLPLDILRKIRYSPYSQYIVAPYLSYPIQRRLISSVSYMGGCVTIGWDLTPADQYINTYKHVLINGMRRWKARREKLQVT